MITFDLIKNNGNLGKVVNVLEIGTGKGDLAYQVLKYLWDNSIQSKYRGFDLFENYSTSVAGITEPKAEADLVQSNDIRQKLHPVCKDIDLYVGDTKDTLAGWVKTNTMMYDLVIINGSHLHQQILQDFYATNSFYNNGCQVFIDYCDGDAKSIVADMDYYDVKSISESVSMLTWKVEESAPQFTEEDYEGPHNPVPGAIS